MSLILASASLARASMLRGAGVAIEIVPMRVDEDSVTIAMLAEGSAPRDIADTLADLKARRASARFSGRLVLGADQVLVCEGKLVNKARDLAEASDTLRSLRGRPHDLYSAAVIYENGVPVWRHIGKARLAMRNFSETFLQGYIHRTSDAILGSVGCYQLEGEGAQLFSRVEGDYFTILGLPLLEVLGFLRLRGVLVE